MVYGEFHEFVLKSGTGQDFIDALEQIAFFAVFFRAVDAD